jgi:hypothetical protein
LTINEKIEQSWLVGKGRRLTTKEVLGSNPTKAEETINMPHCLGFIMLPQYQAKTHLAL